MTTRETLEQIIADSRPILIEWDTHDKQIADQLLYIHYGIRFTALCPACLHQFLEQKDLSEHMRRWIETIILVETLRTAVQKAEQEIQRRTRSEIS